jgi:hypothetical protein
VLSQKTRGSQVQKRAIYIPYPEEEEEEEERGRENLLT